MADSGDVSYPNTGSPVVDNLKAEASKTSNEFRDLKNSRVTPSTTTTNGQPLTHYHSLLYSLLSWEQPRATAVSYATVISFIFAARYLPLLRWAFKFLYMSLGLTALVEIAGQVILKQGIASSFRPRRYYTIPKETHEAILEDLSQLLDFFLIEFQRILFAENVVHTVAAFTAAFTGYWLVRFVPLWGLAVISVTVAYLGPLVYISNREIIDEQINNLQEIISSQTNQLKDLAEERTSHATGVVKQYVGEYSHKAQEYIGRRSASPEMTKVPTPVKTETVTEPTIKTEDFPEAPHVEPIAQPVETVEPVETSEPAPTAAEKAPLLAV
ncbi:putative cwl1 [Penicillium brasilianum]|uniref:Reticulon-like protein n=1 Tax=Penicillium brasilianum TaxID=104259 RepID=A0A1S9RP52_PENBI|nr:putative cwl1 [Penicillium brasilianum]